MTEPPGTGGVSRRGLIRRGGALAAAAGLAGGLAACENTTEPVAAGSTGQRRQGPARRPDRRRPRRRRGHPARAARLPGRPAAHRRHGQVEHEARARRRAQDLQLRRLPRPGDDQGVRQAGGRQRPGDDVPDARGGVQQAERRQPRGRRDLLDARPAVAPRRPPAPDAAQPRARPQPDEERLARAAQPVLRRRGPLQHPVRDLHDGHRLAPRQDRLRPVASSTSRGTRSGTRRSTPATSASSTTSARASAWR